VAFDHIFSFQHLTSFDVVSPQTPPLVLPPDSWTSFQESELNAESDTSVGGTYSLLEPIFRLFFEPPCQPQQYIFDVVEIAHVPQSRVDIFCNVTPDKAPVEVTVTGDVLFVTVLSPTAAELLLPQQWADPSDVTAQYVPLWRPSKSEIDLPSKDPCSTSVTAEPEPELHVNAPEAIRKQSELSSICVTVALSPLTVVAALLGGVHPN
jgi:hypothetical protein